MLKQILLGLGLLVVFGTHIYMLVAGLPSDQVMSHSVANLVAGVLIGVSYFLN